MEENLKKAEENSDFSNSVLHSPELNNEFEKGDESAEEKQAVKKENAQNPNDISLTAEENLVDPEHIEALKIENITLIEKISDRDILSNKSDIPSEAFESVDVTENDIQDQLQEPEETEESDFIAEEPHISETADEKVPGEEMYSLHFFESEKEESDLPSPQTYEEDQEDEDPEYNPKKPRKVDGRFDFIELFVFTLVIVMVITSFFFKHSIVEGVSMEETLFEGEHLIISDLFYTPDHGDIIVCEDYSKGIRTPIVKRVIALGGDKVRIKIIGNTIEVYVNDELINEEDYVHIDGELLPGYKYMDIKVKDGEVFVMGDHRNESFDSRQFGTISEDSILGKVVLRFYPFDRFGTVE